MDNHSDTPTTDPHHLSVSDPPEVSQDSSSDPLTCDGRDLTIQKGQMVKGSAEGLRDKGRVCTRSLHQSDMRKHQETLRHVTVLEKQLAARDKQIALLRAQVEGLEECLKTKDRTIERKAKECQTALSDKRRLEQEVGQLRDQLDARECTVLVLQTKVSSQEGLIKEREEQMSQLRSRLTFSDSRNGAWSDIGDSIPRNNRGENEELVRGMSDNEDGDDGPVSFEGIMDVDDAASDDADEPLESWMRQENVQDLDGASEDSTTVPFTRDSPHPAANGKADVAVKMEGTENGCHGDNSLERKQSAAFVSEDTQDGGMETESTSEAVSKTGACTNHSAQMMSPRALDGFVGNLASEDTEDLPSQTGRSGKTSISGAEAVGPSLSATVTADAHDLKTEPVDDTDTKAVLCGESDLTLGACSCVNPHTVPSRSPSQEQVSELTQLDPVTLETDKETEQESMADDKESSSESAQSRGVKVGRRKRTGKKSYPCEHCDAVFPFSSRLADHYWRKHAERKPHACSECDATFTRPSDLKIHFMIHTGERPYPCKECNVAFRLPADLKCHMRIHTNTRPFVCNICGAARKRANDLKKHQLQHSGLKPYPCTVCGAAFTRSWYLKVHMKRHAGLVERHLCDECGAVLQNLAGLRTHMRMHTGERPFTCKECHFSFKEKSHLSAHKLRKHSTHRPHLCNECGATFLAPAELKSHMRKHTDERPFPCQECGMAFRQSAQLKDHKRIHSNKRPCVCDKCGAAFKRKGDLRTHKLIHSDPKHFCEECGKGFKRLFLLKQHVRRHTGEGVLQCKECGLALLGPKALSDHMRKHTGERPFSCEDCGAKFKQPSHVSAHRRRMHLKNKT